MPRGRQVNILEAKKRLSELIRSVRKGKEVVIANRGEPLARLVPPDGSFTVTNGRTGVVTAYGSLPSQAR